MKKEEEKGTFYFSLLQKQEIESFQIHEIYPPIQTLKNKKPASVSSQSKRSEDPRMFLSGA